MCVCVCVCVCITQFCDPVDYSPPLFSVHRVLQARILEWVANPLSRGSSWPRDRTWVFCIAGGFFTVWAIREVHSTWQSSSTPYLLLLIPRGCLQKPFLEWHLSLSRELSLLMSSWSVPTPSNESWRETSLLPLLGGNTQSQIPYVFLGDSSWVPWAGWEFISCYASAPSRHPFLGTEGHIPTWFSLIGQSSANLPLK